MVQKTLNAGLIAWAKVCGPSQDMCDVCGSKSSARDIRRAFSHALPVRAVDGRVHVYTDRERERDTAGGGGMATRLQRQSMNQSVIVEYCG